MSAVAVVIVVGVVVVGVVLAVVVRGSSRRRHLQARFGPEYDRMVSSGQSRRAVEGELVDREMRHDSFDLRALDPNTRERYAREWVIVQERFVDAPDRAVTGAGDLVITVMRDRGYPTDGHDQQLADLSVEHSDVVGHYRTAHEISRRASTGQASTEDLRQAMVHYRALFENLLDTTAHHNS